MLDCLAVGAGGFLGAVLRYLIGLVGPSSPGALGGFPVRTFLINVAGSLAIGMVAALAARGGLDARWTLFLKVGVCGGFTTFSSFALETEQLLGQGAVGVAALYAGLSVACCVGAAALGWRLAGLAAA